MGKVDFGAWAATVGGRELALRFFSRCMIRFSLGFSLVSKTFCTIGVQKHSSAYLLIGKAQKAAKPQAWPLPPPPGHLKPSPAQPSPAWENGWLGSFQGPEGSERRNLSLGPQVPAVQGRENWQAQ